MSQSVTPLLEVDGLNTDFHLKDRSVRALRGVSFQVRAGESLGIVGESGSGKSVTALSIMGLVSGNYTATGSIRFGGVNMLEMREKEMRRIRGRRIAMIFQDPQGSLNPSMTIGKQIVEAVRLQSGASRAEARLKAIGLLKAVGIESAAARMDVFPHQLSGGMRQRVMIAIALSCDPDLIIADEPTTALDVTIQAQVLEILGDAVGNSHRGLLLITHDMGVVARMCDSVCVMYAGKIVEEGPVSAIFAEPRHPYTAGLLSSVGSGADRKERQVAIPGRPPDVGDELPACAFAPRCANAESRCFNNPPELVQTTPERRLACWNPVVNEGRWSPERGTNMDVGSRATGS